MFVAGADISWERDSNRGWAGIVVFRFPGMEEIERVSVSGRARFPYVPGLLSFREGPVVIRALRRLRCEPDLFLVDSHGLAHPRRMGLACHMGLVFDRPSIGCAKSVLVGKHEEPPLDAGAWTPLRDGDEVLGAALRTRTRVKPVFVSCGHRVSLGTAIGLLLACRDRTRIPKPTREADRLVGELKRRELGRGSPP